MLAIVCRAENNRYYLKRGVELRPGYLARWIEFNVVTKHGERNIVEILKQRQKEEKEITQKNAEEDHVRFFKGIDRNLNTKAI